VAKKNQNAQLAAIPFSISTFYQINVHYSSMFADFFYRVVK